jgi:hypothetical protein
MEKTIWLFIKEKKGKKTFRLMESVAGKPLPAVGRGVESESEDLDTIVRSILRMAEIHKENYQEKPKVEFEPPNGFDPEKFFPLDPVQKLVVREKLGISPG